MELLSAGGKVKMEAREQEELKRDTNEEPQLISLDAYHDGLASEGHSRESASVLKSEAPRLSSLQSEEL